MRDIRLRPYESFAEEAEGDAEFWLQMTPEERVELVEVMRREWQERNGQPDERLRRTYIGLDALLKNKTCGSAAA